MLCKGNGVLRKRDHYKIILISFVCLLSLLAINPITAQEGKRYGKISLKEYEPKTGDEATIIDTLIEYENGFNSHDIQKLLSFFAKDAMYRPCGKNTKYPIGSKACQNLIKYNFGSFKFETYYDPRISVNGNKAVVNLLLET